MSPWHNADDIELAPGAVFAVIDDSDDTLSVWERTSLHTNALTVAAHHLRYSDSWNAFAKRTLGL